MLFAISRNKCLFLVIPSRFFTRIAIEKYTLFGIILEWMMST